MFKKLLQLVVAVPLGVVLVPFTALGFILCMALTAGSIGADLAQSLVNWFNPDAGRITIK